MPATNGHDPSSHAFPPMMSAFSQATAATLKALADHLGEARAVGSGWKCRCPCHDDREPSLELSLGEDGRVLAVCRAGCPKEATWAAVMATGVLPRPERRTARPPRRRGGEVTTYVYRDADGAALFHKLRHPPGHEPRFTLCRPDGSHGIKGVARVPYHLPEVVGAEEVIVAEGEKDCDRLAALGLVATCNFDGASADGKRPKWRAEYDRHFAGKHVIVLADNDDPGRAHADHIARRLLAVARSVRRVDFPELPEKGDVSDWLDGGHTLEDLRARIAATPELTRAAAAEAEARPVPTGWQANLRRKGERGDPVALEGNVIIALEQAPELRGRLRWNTLSQLPESGDMPWAPGGDWRPWSDDDQVRLSAWLMDHDLYVRPAVCRGAALAVARAEQHNPVKAYLERVAWDGADRLTTFFQDYFGTVVDPERPRHAEYLACAARIMMIQAVERGITPGEKADYTVVLESLEQGKRKSTSIAALVPDQGWFTSQLAKVGTKDASIDLLGKWIIELSELSAVRKVDAETVKTFLGERKDHYRPPYETHPRDFPRGCVFIASTNQETYLLDQSGNRRFVPVRVGMGRPELLARDRDQLWAQARALWLQGGQWWGDIEGLAREEQEDRREVDGWEAITSDWLVKRRRLHEEDQHQPLECTTQDVLDQALQMPKERQDRYAQIRAGHALRQAGWESHRPRDGGNRLRRYRPGPTARVPPPTKARGRGPNEPADWTGDWTGKNPDNSTPRPNGPIGPNEDDVFSHGRGRVHAHDARHAPARTHESVLPGPFSYGPFGPAEENPSETTGSPRSDLGAGPIPWTQWVAWRQRCAAGNERTVLGAWLAEAGGVVGKRTARVPKGLPEGDAKRWLLESLLGIGLMIEEF